MSAMLTPLRSHTVYDHHAASIDRVTAHFQRQPEVEALLLGGSIAHGFAVAASDVDIMILISDARYEERLREGCLGFYSKELCTYPEGYVDGKYLGMGYLMRVAERGSEPARFAFKDAKVLFSRNGALDGLLEAIVRYPTEGKAERMRRFYAQFEAWNWYTHEALRLENPYLLGVSLGRLVLFGGRLILTHNELLYPYHKWFLRVLERANDRPPDLIESIEALYADTTPENVQRFYALIRDFRDWGASASGWPSQFMLDSELNWQNGATPIDDL